MQNEFVKTALHYAAENDHVDVVKYLIEKGANINAQNKDGKIALNSAVAENKTAIVSKLLR